MQPIPYWIQRADFTTTEREPVGATDAVAAFKSHDWDAELELLEARQASSWEFCPPGIGFVPGDGRILHACPDRGGVCLVHYHFYEPRRILGIFPFERHRSISADSISSSDVLELIELLFRSDHETLVSRLEQSAA